MDKLEYINGDVVMYDNKIMVIKEPREEEHFDLLWDTWIIYSYINIEEINPISLTHEILEKNGWKKDGKWYKLTTKRAYLYITKDTKSNDEFLVCVGKEKYNLASVSFTHELQHLLFGLGLNSEMEV